MYIQLLIWKCQEKISREKNFQKGLGLGYG